jgi:hypothetical protein
MLLIDSTLRRNPDMKKEKSTNTAIRIAPSEKVLFDKTAEDMKITFTDLLKKGAYLYGALNPAFREKIQRFSRNLGIEEYLVLQNLAISWMARREAEAEVLGDEAESILLEFQFTENGLLTGEQLHENLKRYFIRRYEAEKENALQMKAQYVTLSDEEAKWLKARDERLVNAVEAQKRAKESRAKGLTASYSEGEDEAKILADMKAKREKAGIK